MRYVKIYMHIVFNRNIHAHVYKSMQTHVYKDDIHMFMRTHTCIHLFIRAPRAPKHHRQVVEAGAHLSLGQGVSESCLRKRSPGKRDQEKCQDAEKSLKRGKWTALGTFGWAQSCPSHSSCPFATLASGPCCFTPWRLMVNPLAPRGFFLLLIWKLYKLSKDFLGFIEVIWSNNLRLF